MEALPKKIVVVGNGMVGHRFLEYLVESEWAPHFTITVFCAESRPAYDRVHLSDFFSGASADDLSLVEGDFFNQHNIDLRVGAKVTKIDRDSKQVIDAAGAATDYDALILATGSYPFVPPIPGHDQPHCHVYRTVDDLRAMQASGASSTKGVVVGGGLLGLEAANALKNMGLETHVVEFAPQLMGVQVDERGGELLCSMIEGLGVRVHTGMNTQCIEDGENSRYAMRFASGDTLETDMIVFSAGIRPEDSLARANGLQVGERGGIVIDNFCRTSDPDILAIGECALWDNRIFGLVAPGYDMARVAVSTLCADGAEFKGADMSTKLKLLGMDVASVGDAHGRTEGSHSYSYLDEAAQVYKKIVVNKTGKKLLGAVLVGDAGEYGMLQQSMLHELAIPKHPETLILPQREGGAPASNVDALPDVAQICSCHDVSKGDICGAVAEGSTTIGDLKSCTRAGTGCGGCVPLLTQVLNSQLAALGMEVSTDLCEHFPHTRQELFHLVRVGNIRSFDELLQKHGRGQGCDICKPASASILASCWNEYVLTPQHAGLQDTNDHFLANMQKDGTYSIVPRVPGGEITPEKLIVLGEVGKKYGLYTKITGAQRIDLFGAEVHQLPLIWKELIDAGFETGHAYGKSLRTVKSCVGSTWCRYGVLDSVTMAIDLENRYKGLRSPHKLKMAVSGCTRECAEAQGKDVGVIATEHGWNLYVCGNGGMRPRHADLFATGLSDEELLRYIDRFLMFYVRTADRLQRTSVWMENLEGGLDYLKEVVINDSLGIAAELEQDMARVIDTYECEWKKAIEDPDSLKRFRTFINDDQSDPNVVFVSERAQRRPARADEKQRLTLKAVS